ncbi:MAG: hypothetical protein K6E37_03890 [Bacteroidales bacterium]|nr:hypothetical protein [Bacteroidales bacterium]
MIKLACEGLTVELCRPGEYYLGTRFDRAGIFRRIVMDDYAFADEWFSHQDPFRHDRVCGLSEEFVTVDWTRVPVDGLFCKPGVGLLRRPDGAEYDRFRLYEVVDPGIWEVNVRDDEVVYEHTLKGWYSYSKRIILLEGGRLELVHSLDWEAREPLSGYFYNHNFITFGGLPVGPARRFSFPWQPAGDWRRYYDNAGFVPGGVAFYGPVEASTAVFCGNLHNADGPTTCDFIMADGSRSVHVRGSRLLTHIVLWANDRVACLEPYLSLQMAPGASCHWSFAYEFR